jgi:hypothetical protein
MTDESEYFFADRPLYTQEAVQILDAAEDEVSEALEEGDTDQKPLYALLHGEKASLQQCLDRLEPYNDFMDETYRTFEVLGPHVLERVEEDMSVMARERFNRLDQKIFDGSQRRDFLEQQLTDEAPRPVMRDTWIIMESAEDLREYLDRTL